MTDPTTPNRGLAVPLRGTDVGTWDTPLNNNFGSIDTLLGAVGAVSLSNSNVTLDASQASYGTIQFVGTLTANVTVTFPSVQGWWSIDNQTTGNFYVLLTCGGGNNIAVPPGEIVDVQADGTNMRFRNLGRIGSYLDLSVSTTPSWITACSVPPYLNCDGSTFSAITYPVLNTILGGNTLPDLRGSLRATLNQGTSRITTAGSGIDGDTRFSIGGAQNIAIAQANLPAVAPTFTGTAKTVSVSSLIGWARWFSDSTTPGGGFGIGTVASGNQTVTSQGTYTPSGTISTLGSGTPLNKMPPTTIAGITLIRAA